MPRRTSRQRKAADRHLLRETQRSRSLAPGRASAHGSGRPRGGRHQSLGLAPPLGRDRWFVSVMPWSEWVGLAVALVVALAGLVVCFACFWALLRGRPRRSHEADLGQASGRGG